jgi:hypothetical protein
VSSLFVAFAVPSSKSLCILFPDRPASRHR